jgi:WD40 repeat protein
MTTQATTCIYPQAEVTYTAHSRTVQALAWSPDGTRLASGDASGVVQVWETATGQTQATHQEDPPASVCALAWSPVEDLIASGGRHPHLSILEAESLKEVARWRLRGAAAPRPGGAWYGRPSRAILAMAWSPDGKRFLSGGQDGPGHRLRLWETLDGLERLLDPAEHLVRTVAWSPDGQRFAAGGDFGSAGVWDATTGEMLRQFSGFLPVVSQLSWSPDGACLAACGLHKECLVWHGSGEVLTRYQGHHRHVLSLAWAPESERIASASHDQTIHIWEATTGQCLASYACQLGNHPLIAWSPDGTRLVVTLADATIQIWRPV